MKLKQTGKSWHKLGTQDPLFAILTYKDKRGGKWEKKEFFETGRKEVKESIDYLNSLGVQIKKDTALDFGCGVGRLSQALSDYFKEVHGVDIAESMISLANEYNQYGSRCRYYTNSAGNLRFFPDKMFDFIYSKITLQHMEPKYALDYLKEFLRVLKPDGTLLFQLPSEPVPDSRKTSTVKSRVKKLLPEWLISLYRKLTPNARPLIEMYGIKKSEIVKLMEEMGGKVIDIKQNREAGEKWISYQYIVKKQREL